MKTISEEIILDNKGGKFFHVFMNIFLFVIVYLIFSDTDRFYLWPFSFTFYSAFFAFKSVKVSSEGIKVVYHLRPFLRIINCPVKSIRKIRFNLFDGGETYPNISFALNRYPFFFEIRLEKKDEVEDVFQLLCKDGEFKIKPLSDKRIMKIRLKEIGKDSKCKVI